MLGCHGWLGSCYDGLIYAIMYNGFYFPGGAGFQPSTVALMIYHIPDMWDL